MAEPFTIPAWLEPIVDRLPVAVRQLRQQLRGRLWTGLLLGLPFLLLIGTGAAITTSHSTGLPSGPLLFTAIAVVWSVVAWVILPSLAGRALLAERREGTWDLVELAGLPGPALAWGFWSAGMVQILLVSTLFMPFLVMAWLLRGIGLDLLLMTLIGIPVVACFSTAVAVSSCSGKIRKRMSGPEGAVLGVTLLPGWIFAGVTTARGGGAVPAATIIMVLTIVAALAATNLASAGVRLSHPASNRSTIPRLVTMIAAVIVAGWGLWFEFSQPGSGWLTACAFIVVIIAWLMGTESCAEYVSVSRRQAAWFAVPSPWRRMTGWFLGPGGYRGRRAYLLLIGLGILLASIASQRHAHGHVVAGIMVLSGYASLSLVIADLMERILRSPEPHRPLRQSTYARLGPLVLGIVGGILGMLTHGEGIRLLIVPWMVGGAISEGAKGGDVILAASLGTVATIILAVQAMNRESGGLRIASEPAGGR